MPDRRKGFTLVEMLIATAVLGVGLAGIVALFPTTIATASKVVEETYCSSIAESVVAALAAARRQHQIFAALPAGTGTPSKYLIFDHDGVLDPLPDPRPGMGEGEIKGSDFYARSYGQDYVLLLPHAQNPGNKFPATFPVAAPNTVEPTLLYPSVPPSLELAGPRDDRSPIEIRNGVDDQAGTLYPTAEGNLVLFVRRTYPVGRYRSGTAPQGFATGDVRAEFLAPPDDGTAGKARSLADSYPQYSFAFTLRRVAFDLEQQYNSELYELHIMMFRNFDGSPATLAAIVHGSPVPRTNVPIHEFITQIDVGPKGDAPDRVVTINGAPLNSVPGLAVPAPAPPPGLDALEPNPGEQY